MSYPAMTTIFRVEQLTYDDLAGLCDDLGRRFPDLVPTDSPRFYYSPGAPGVSIEVIGCVAEVWTLERNTVHQEAPPHD